MTAKRKSKGAYMISSVAEMYGIHPQTLRLYEREGLLKPSRTDGNTRLYTEEDLQRLEFILSLARDLGVNIAGMAIIIQMRERMEEMNRQMQDFVRFVQQEIATTAVTQVRQQPHRYFLHLILPPEGYVCTVQCLSLASIQGVDAPGMRRVQLYCSHCSIQVLYRSYGSDYHW